MEMFCVLDLKFTDDSGNLTVFYGAKKNYCSRSEAA
jgi:hypothetical protein